VKNRSYLHNQAVSLGLAFAVGLLALASVASTSSSKAMLAWAFFGHTENVAITSLQPGFGCVQWVRHLLFFLIY
jgi:hypothetical protein